jgi:hypothetical protein
MLLKLFVYGSAYLGHIAGTFGIQRQVAGVMLSGESHQFWGNITRCLTCPIVANKRSSLLAISSDQVQLLIAYICRFHQRDDQSKGFIIAIIDSRLNYSHTPPPPAKSALDQGFAVAVSGKAMLEIKTLSEQS